MAIDRNDNIGELIDVFGVMCQQGKECRETPHSSGLDPTARLSTTIFDGYQNIGDLSRI
jgi:hypothetical protein